MYRREKMTEIGTILDGKYEILKMIGKGGMSYVYLAIDNRLKKQWAIKEVRMNGQNINLMIGRLVSETNILKKIDHPVIPRIVDILQENDLLYVVMDYVEGRTMAEVLLEEGAQPQEKVIEWGIQLADALNYLHSMTPPIIYRDMKPSNVMLRPDGSIKLIDFGTAKEFDVENLADTTALGTRGYAAPEQFGDSKGRGKYNTDARTDIYSLGATLYHIVTGKNPSEPPYEIRPIREWNTELSQGLENIIQKCTQADPAKRYENCLGLLYDLENYDHLDKSYQRKNWLKILTCLASFVLTVVFFGLSVYGKYGQKQVVLKEYESIINQAELAVMEQDYTKALNALQVAITQIDSTREEAYREMLNIYSMQDKPEDGLTSVCKYIDTYSGAKCPPDEIVFEVAKRFFYDADYKKCYQYAVMVKNMEEAQYYGALARILSSMYVDEKEYKTELENFEQYNNTLPDSKNKLDNYKALAIIYVTRLKENNNAAESVAQICEEALSLLEESEEWLEKEEEAAYEKVFLEYATNAYEWLKKNTEDLTEKQKYYRMIEMCCEDAVALLDDDRKLERDTKSNMMLKLAGVYMEQGKFSDGFRVYEQMEEVYTEESDNRERIYVAHILALCEEQESKTENKKKWDREKILQLQKKAEQSVPSIKSNREWKKILADLELK